MKKNLLLTTLAAYLFHVTFVFSQTDHNTNVSGSAAFQAEPLGWLSGTANDVDIINNFSSKNINLSTFNGSLIQRMIILSTGEVGIGTIAPLRALEVNNDINLSSSTLNHGYRIGDIVVLQKPGSENIFVGENAGGTSLTSGNQNVVVGKDAGASLTDGTGNVLIGFEAGNKVQNSSSYENTFVGLQAGKATGTSGLNGNHNCFFGDNAGLKNDDGSENTFIG